jgi:2-oxoglutarate dehydrogenase E1 component
MSMARLFPGINIGYVLELYERYQQDPNAVDPAWRAFFERWGPELVAEEAAMPSVVAAPAVDLAKVAAVVNLAESIRMRGHRAAQLDPLGSSPPGDPALDAGYHGLSERDLEALPASIIGGPIAQSSRNAHEAITRLRAVYCGTIGYDFGHVEEPEEREWLIEAVESGRYASPPTPEQKRALLERLTQVEAFERFLHRAFVGQKRFSIEGTDMLVPMLDEILSSAAEAGIPTIAMGMAHRGRLNVLAHVLGKPYEQIIAEFMGLNHREPFSEAEGGSMGYTGDVKYHLGAKRPSGELPLQITLASNPSHLEFVNPVVEGIARAAQDRRDQPGAPPHSPDSCLPILIHGDAAFPGEGIVAETLNMAQLPGYTTGGTIHIIVNNQLGYTTEPWEGRSTAYASDIARGYEIPVIHVNADDPEACLIAVRLAFAYRQRFHKDVLIDLIGYRRWGHNEGDEPSFTQPRMYAVIGQHPTVRELWARRLEAEGLVTADEARALEQRMLERLQAIRQELASHRDGPSSESHIGRNGRIGQVQTAVPIDWLRELNRQAHALPEGFNLNPKLRRQLQRRLEVVERDGSLDWAHAELLAFASILADGIPIRLTGQDTVRGTFSQRHVAFFDVETNERVIPLQRMPAARASFDVHNSPLAEAAPLGFEYGYSVQAPETLVLWEAQFGDFANAAQVIIDQFIASARAKWQETSGLVLLLPHGYEGQGPEHSSARLERFLQLAAEDNLRIANCTTAAQYFHLLRRQAALLKTAPRPLVIMTPKSLLRHPKAASPLAELAQGSFRPVLDDPEAGERAPEITRLILCCGKVYVDLITSPQWEQARHVAIVRVEQLYPFPGEELRQVIERYPNARDVVWLQEEPKNMGAWTFIEPRLRPLLDDRTLRYIGRPERASPAEGLAELHDQEQARIVTEAFEGVPEPALRS